MHRGYGIPKIVENLWVNRVGVKLQKIYIFCSPIFCQAPYLNPPRTTLELQKLNSTIHQLRLAGGNKRAGLTISDLKLPSTIMKNPVH